MTCSLLPVLLGVGEDEVQHWHQQDVAPQKDEQWEVASGPEWVGEEDKDEKTTYDLEENGQEEHDSGKERGKIFIERSTLEGGVVGGETPWQTEIIMIINLTLVFAYFQIITYD